MVVACCTLLVPKGGRETNVTQSHFLPFLSCWTLAAILAGCVSGWLHSHTDNHTHNHKTNNPQGS